jgi:hypothetical protein
MSGFNSKRLMAKSRDGGGIEINGLTRTDCLLLDMIWSFAELEELEAWQATLRPAIQRRVDDLIKMVLLAHLDQEMESVKRFPEANDYLRKFRL